MPRHKDHHPYGRDSERQKREREAVRRYPVEDRQRGGGKSRDALVRMVLDEMEDVDGDEQEE